MQDLLADIDIKPVLAKKRMRWFAAAIDHIILFIVWMTIAYAFGDNEMDANGNTSFSLTGLPAFFAIIITWLLLIPGIESINHGQTIGKAILGVRAVREDGGSFHFGTAIARHILDFVDYFPFLGIVGLIVASNNREQKRVGDKLAQTIVIDARKQAIA